MANCKISVIDVETTGLSPYKHEIIEFSILLASYDLHTKTLSPVEQYTGRREPGCAMDPGAAAVHGITMQQLKGQQLDSPVIHRLMAESDLLVSHNARFDRPFVMRLFPMASEKPWFCSMAGIDWKGRGYSSRGLQYLLSQHGIDPRVAHSASGDVLALFELLTHHAYLDEMLGKPPAYLSMVDQTAAADDNI